MNNIVDIFLKKIIIELADHISQRLMTDFLLANDSFSGIYNKLS